MKPAIIVVDIGNTSTSFALAREGRIVGITRLPTHGPNRPMIRRCLAELTRGCRIQGAAVCSVVPAQNRLWIRELKRLTGRIPLRIHHRLKLDVAIDYPRPATIGADRLANACAATERYGTPVIVADFGTALTFDIISRNRAYIGGIITPGLPLMTDYLADRTALLPRIRLSDEGKRAVPFQRQRVIGKSTEQAMIIGARLGYTGMVREIFSRLKQSLQEPRIRLCATGGYASWALAGSDIRVSIDPDLTLYGISRIYDLNRPED
ncbi:MAG: type III pantothenate kinase [Kiritimatiellae bacterium]|nr:type III pantothenate kinase [Verrucomicrobiota bacterium]MCG2680339.1 type III pantothenate kinase [Kiritimatiellia bacterium]